MCASVQIMFTTIIYRHGFSYDTSGYTLLVRINIQFVLLRDTVENTAIAIVQNLLDQAAELTYLALFPVSTPSFFFAQSKKKREGAWKIYSRILPHNAEA